MKHRYQKKRLCRICLKKGFTLIELLIVIAVVGILVSVSLPVSYSMYQKYQASLRAEEVWVFLSSLRREAFLYSEEKCIYSKEGRLLVNDSEMVKFKDMFVQIDQPVRIYKSGATSGGEIKIYVNNYTFVVEIQAPFGNIVLRRGL